MGNFEQFGLSENNLTNICGMEGYALSKFESKLLIVSRDYENNNREDSKKSGYKQIKSDSCNEKIYLLYAKLTEAFPGTKIILTIYPACVNLRQRLT